MQDQGTVLGTATRLFERAFILVFSVMLVVSLLYVVGNYQGFTDRTQRQLLETMQAAGGIASVGGTAAFLLETIVLVYRRTLRGVLRLLLVAIAAVLAFGVTVGSSGILVFLAPV